MQGPSTSSQSNRDYSAVNTDEAVPAVARRRVPLFATATTSSWRRRLWIAVTLLLVIVAGLWLSPLDRTSRRNHKSLHPRNSKLVLDGTEYSTFKIIQIADLHLGEAEATDWGPAQDRKTWIALDRVLSYENPDFIVLSGDQLTANNVDANATAYYDLLGDFLSSYDTPWALIFGNHDDAPLEMHLNPANESDITRIPAKTSKQQLARVDMSYAMSQTQVGPSHLFGVSNYVVPIYKALNDEVAAQVILLDTGGGSVPAQLNNSQVSWFLQQRKGHSDIPAFVFQHIPLGSFVFQENSCVGFNGDGGIDPVPQDSEMTQTYLQDGNVWWVAVGHNHGNDYVCRVKGKDDVLVQDSKLHWCFGRHSGYGGYGTWDRGARVYELDVDGDSVVTGWRTWVRLESGDMIDAYDPMA